MGFGEPVSSESGYLFSCFWHTSHFDIARRHGDKDLIWYRTFLLRCLGNGDYITSYHRVHIDSANGKGKMFGGMPHGSFGDKKGLMSEAQILKWIFFVFSPLNVSIKTIKHVENSKMITEESHKLNERPQLHRLSGHCTTILLAKIYSLALYPPIKWEGGTPSEDRYLCLLLPNK